MIIFEKENKIIYNCTHYLCEFLYIIATFDKVPSQVSVDSTYLAHQNIYSDTLLTFKPFSRGADIDGDYMTSEYF